MKKVVCIMSGMGFGGSERVMSQVIKYLDYKNVKVVLVTMDDKPSSYELPKDVIHKPINPRKNKSIILKKVYRIIDLRKIIKGEYPDVVLSFITPMNVITLLSLIGTNIPVVVSERNDPRNSPKQWYFRLLRRITYKMASGVVCQTQEYIEYFNKRIQNKCTVIYNPLKSDLPISRKSEREPIISTVGRLVEAKNQKLLIDAFNEVIKKHTNYKLYIYGEGQEKQNLETYIKKLNLEDKIILKGTYSNIHDEIKKSELFVLSSDYEGIPNALMEAMAIGIPSISTNFDGGGASVLIENGKNGIIIQKGNKKQLKESMIRLIEDKELYEELSNESIKVREKFKFESIMNDWQLFLENNCK